MVLGDDSDETMTEHDGTAMAAGPSSTTQSLPPPPCAEAKSKSAARRDRARAAKAKAGSTGATFPDLAVERREAAGRLAQYKRESRQQLASQGEEELGNS